MKRLGVMFLTAATLTLGTVPALAGGWAWSFHAGRGYPAGRIPSTIDGFGRRDSGPAMGGGLDYQITDCWRLGIDAGGISLGPSWSAPNVDERLRIVNANVHATYLGLSGWRFRPFGTLGIGVSSMRQEWITHHRSVEGADFTVDKSQVTTRSFEGEIGVGVDWTVLTSRPPFLHAVLLSEYHDMPARYRPRVSSAGYFGVSLGLLVTGTR